MCDGFLWSRIRRESHHPKAPAGSGRRHAAAAPSIVGVSLRMLDCIVISIAGVCGCLAGQNNAGLLCKSGPAVAWPLGQPQTSRRSQRAPASCQNTRSDTAAQNTGHSVCDLAAGASSSSWRK